MADYYDSIADGYDELHGSEQLRKFNLVKKYINGKILDVGCGTGIVWKTDMGLNTWDVTGIDPSKELLKKAKHIKTILGSGEFLPFPVKSFDTVTCFTAIHNFVDPVKGLKEMMRVSCGVIIVSILKKSSKKRFIGELVSSMFGEIVFVDDLTDDVYVLTVPSSE